MGRFPFGMPNSWFHVLYSDDLPPGAVKPLNYLERDLVAFRTQDGQAHVFDAFCPHLGAHLGVGGKVVDDTIQCPFHGFRYDGSGSCVAIPYANKIPPKLRIKTWEVRERNGIIYLWHHTEDKPPDFEIPEIPEWGNPDFTSSWQKYEWTVKTQPQEVMENAIDWPHFHMVHQMDMPERRSHKFDGKMFHWNIGTKKQVRTMEGVEDSLYMESQNWGLGFAFVRYTGMFQTAIVTGLTPIDSETLHFQTGIIGKKDGRTEQETVEILKAYMDDQSLAITQDFQVWENKKFRPRPMLCDGDGPIGEYRKWARQFYTVDWLERASGQAG